MIFGKVIANHVEDILFVLREDGIYIIPDFRIYDKNNEWIDKPEIGRRVYFANYYAVLTQKDVEELLKQIKIGKTKKRKKEKKNGS